MTFRTELKILKELSVNFSPIKLRFVVSAVLAVSSFSTFAQEWPSKTIKWIVPYLAGTAPDMTVRVMADAMSGILKQPIVVDNRGGAAGNIGAQAAARAPADGYTWVYSAAPMATNMRMYKVPGFDVMKDFTHVSRIGSSDIVLVVNSESGIKNVQELIDVLRKSGGKLNYGSGGVGTPAHLSAELLLNSIGAEALHIPYKGASEAVNALLGKQVNFVLPIFSVALPHVKAGKLTALAVTGSKRNPVLPDVPTLTEAKIPGVVLISFGGLSVPAGTPPAIVARLNEVVRQALERPTVRAKLEALGSQLEPSTPEQYTDDFRNEIALIEKMMRLAKLEPQ
jgi:tripartite-type tricarboxylate transporter receptor subunit TctC